VEEMTMRLIAVLVGLSAATTLAAEQPQSSALREGVEQLVRLEGEAYAKARQALLEKTKDAKEFLAVKEQSPDWHVKLLCDALYMRLTDMETADMLAEYLDPFKGFLKEEEIYFGARRVAYGSPIRPMRHDLYYAYWSTIMNCFGAKALPILAENLLHKQKVIARPGGMLDAIVELRDERAADIVMEIAEKWDSLRTRATYQLSRMVAGLGPIEIPIEVEGRPIITAPQLRDLARKVELPAFTLGAEKKAAVLRQLGAMLLRDEDILVRALAADALQYGDANAVKPLAEALASNGSAWVRAICVFSLKQIGSKEAMAVVKKAIQDEVAIIEVNNGNVRPFRPERGVPQGVIVEPLPNTKGKEEF
jgi:hypothetical protein